MESSNAVLGTKRCRDRQVHDVTARHGKRPVSGRPAIQRHRTRLSAPNGVGFYYRAVSGDEGENAGCALTALGRFLAGRLPSGGFPTGCFFPALACGFALGFRTSPIALVTLARFDLGLGALSSIDGKRAAYIVRFDERRPKLVSAHIPLVRP